MMTGMMMIVDKKICARLTNKKEVGAIPRQPMKTDYSLGKTIVGGSTHTRCIKHLYSEIASQMNYCSEWSSC